MSPNKITTKHHNNLTSSPGSIDKGPIVGLAEVSLEEIFGEKNAKLAKPLFLKNRTLTITCQTLVIAQEIHLHQQEIVDKINQKLGKKEVDRIRYLT